MIRDYTHAARLQHAWEGAYIDLTASIETEQLFALKVILNACGFDEPDVLHDALEAAITDDINEAGRHNRNFDADDHRDAFRCNLEHGASLTWALGQIPDMAAAHAKAQAKQQQAREYRAAFQAAFGFIVSFGAQAVSA